MTPTRNLRDNKITSNSSVLCDGAPDSVSRSLIKGHPFKVTVDVEKVKKGPRVPCFL